MANLVNHETGRRRPPQLLASDRPPDARQCGESIQAYRAFISYLQEGSIRDAAISLETNRRTLERYSLRWRWPERVRLILARHAERWKDLASFEELHDLDAAEDPDELAERKMAAFCELSSPRIDAELEENLDALNQSKH